MITTLFLIYMFTMHKLGYGIGWYDVVALIVLSFVNFSAFCIKLNDGPSKDKKNKFLGKIT